MALIFFMVPSPYNYGVLVPVALFGVPSVLIDWYYCNIVQSYWAYDLKGDVNAQ